MKLCGIIVEYNPLHNGHVYQLEEARKKSGADAVAVVMSGSFVQRGGPSAYDKWLRAKWAVKAGADIVLELPAVYSLQAADGFAFGGVSVLSCLKGFDFLSFGSESTDERSFSTLSSLYDDPQFDALVKSGAKEGKSYPEAVLKAAENLIPEYVHLLKNPNSLLGAAYTKALKKLSPKTRIVPIGRKGSLHDSKPLCGEFSSASAIREALITGSSAETLEALPDFVKEDVKNIPPISLKDLELPLLYKLRTSSASELSELYGVDEGLENLLKKSAGSLDELTDNIKSRRYTLPRLRRMLCSVLLDIKTADISKINEALPYVRVLAVKKAASALLGEFKNIPLITKKSDADRLLKEAKAIYDKDCLASDITALCRSDKRAYRDFTEPLLFL